MISFGTEDPLRVLFAMLAILSAALLVATTNAGVPSATLYSYENQQNWPGVCVNGHTGRQSPVAISERHVRMDPKLITLEFNYGWTMPVKGSFTNTGYGVQFSPSKDSPKATTRLHLGTYELVQMHMHWGRNDGQGSEHTIDSSPYSLEIHFVLTKQGATDNTASDYYAVIGVLAQADAAVAISGVWEQLNASEVLVYPSSIDNIDFVYASLLPNTRNYYHYKGSLTTPPCSETVQWFVMKEPITVPSKYLAYLRKVQSANKNETLSFNFRNLQPLHERIVYTNQKDNHHSANPSVCVSYGRQHNNYNL